MKILYIDNKQYLHNSDSHIDFISSLEKNKFFKVIGYGDYLNKKLSASVRVKKNAGKQLDSIIRHHRPDAILTYNSGPNIIELYRWISEKLSKIDIPKFHIATDYLRDGFEESQANWFDEVGYEAVLFRHKACLEYPLGVKKFLLPLSIKASLYKQNAKRKIGLKSRFHGAL